MKTAILMIMLMAAPAGAFCPAPDFSSAISVQAYNQCVQMEREMERQQRELERQQRELEELREAIERDRDRT